MFKMDIKHWKYDNQVILTRFLFKKWKLLFSILFSVHISDHKKHRKSSKKVPRLFILFFQWDTNEDPDLKNMVRVHKETRVGFSAKFKESKINSGNFIIFSQYKNSKKTQEDDPNNLIYP